MAKRVTSRASEARVQKAIDVIKKMEAGIYLIIIRPSARCRLQNTKAFSSVSRITTTSFAVTSKTNSSLYNYTRSRKLFEIRRPATVCEIFKSPVNKAVWAWQDRPSNLKGRDRRDIVAAAKEIRSLGRWGIRMFQALGEAGVLAPDMSFCHSLECPWQCRGATIVFEMVWTQPKRVLYEKARRYICSANSDVRTVVGFNLHDIFLAEMRNQKRNYSDDQENETAEATFAVWRAIPGRGNRNKAQLAVPEQVFRDNKGSPIPSVDLHLSLNDFICEGMGVETPRKGIDDSLVISSKELCASINYGLGIYRMQKNNTKKT
ncbi:hypothetical protein F5B21DRAFT_508901 [Xylaria acuta]|nr:hypothetical protein F5B21DRAFT_508901 [Xylaria acuta]